MNYLAIDKYESIEIEDAFCDENIKAIFQYLKSTKPVNNIVPIPISTEQIQ